MRDETSDAEDPGLIDPEDAARSAGLRYVSDEQAGITRVKAGEGFSYRKSNGTPVTDERTLERIRKLAIPPAWTDVWICNAADGHLQATGRDVRGRKQYRYHPRFREVREETKYEHMMAFARALPDIRKALGDHMALRGLPREKVLATVVHLLETTLIRVGNDDYAKENKSYGLTTLRNRHAKVAGSKVVFNFKGKSGVKHRIDLEDGLLAKIVKECQELPGQELFSYVSEDGEVRSIAARTFFFAAACVSAVSTSCKASAAITVPAQVRKSLAVISRPVISRR